MTWGAAEIQGNPTASIKVELDFLLLLFEFCFVFFGPTLRLLNRLPFQQSKLKTKIFVASTHDEAPAGQRVYGLGKKSHPSIPMDWIDGQVVIPQKKHPKPEPIGSMIRWTMAAFKGKCISIFPTWILWGIVCWFLLGRGGFPDLLRFSAFKWWPTNRRFWGGQL